MNMEQGFRRLFIVSGTGIVLGGAFAKVKNKNILLGGVLGLISSIGLLYGYTEIEKIYLNAKRKKEADLTKNMTQEQKNQYAISKGGKAPVAL